MAEKKAREPKKTTRREITKAAAYVVPVVVTLAAAPAFAQSASGIVGDA